MKTSLNLPSVTEFYRGSRIFITGGTGFMGKVLIEKLLRSCSDLDKIYLLLRPKKGRDPSSRIEEITNSAVFDRLRAENPSAFGKLVAVGGDIKDIGLGLSATDRETLQNEVNVIFHSAASVRFDDFLRDAVLINVRGTLEVVKLALGMTNLKALLHVSTTYSNCDQPEVVEEIYPAPGNWRNMIQFAEENTQDYVICTLTKKIIGKMPNTYTYAKALGEQVISDYQDQLPVAIVRPSIVISAYAEPIPGWIDNFNGPVGLMIGGGMGILRSVYADPNNAADYVPCDVAIKTLIYIAYRRGVTSATESVPVYNCTGMVEPRTLYDVIEQAVTISDEIPLNNILWYRNPTITSNRLLHYLKVVFFHMIPALLVDGLLKLSGRKPMLIKIQRRIYIANVTLSIFITNKFTFRNTKLMQLEKDFMLPEDVAEFSYTTRITDSYLFMKNAVISARVHLLKDPLSSLPQARIHYRRMYWLDRICKALLFSGLFWVFGGCAFSHKMISCGNFYLNLI